MRFCLFYVQLRTVVLRCLFRHSFTICSHLLHRSSFYVYILHLCDRLVLFVILPLPFCALHILVVVVLPPHPHHPTTPFTHTFYTPFTHPPFVRFTPPFTFSLVLPPVTRRYLCFCIWLHPRRPFGSRFAGCLTTPHGSPIFWFYLYSSSPPQLRSSTRLCLLPRLHFWFFLFTLFYGLFSPIYTRCSDPGSRAVHVICRLQFYGSTVVFCRLLRLLFYTYYVQFLVPFTFCPVPFSFLHFWFYTLHFTFYVNVTNFLVLVTFYTAAVILPCWVLLVILPL